MINFAGFGDGWREQGELRRRQRIELAKAFEEFKRNNPYATADEYQAFIDQNVGGGMGANYIRGGVPGRDVLEALAKDNQTRKQRETARQRIEDLKQRHSLIGDMQGSVDGFIMAMDGDDFDGAYANFIDQYGEGADEMFQGMNLRNYFTPKYRDQLMGEKLIDLTPKISQYLKATDGNLEDTEAFARYLNIPKGQIQPFVDAAKREHERSIATWTMQNNDKVISTINREIAAGRDPEKAVATLLQGSGIKIEDYDLETAKAEATRIRSLEDDERNRKLEEARVAATAQMEQTFRTDPAIQGAMRRGDQAKVTELMMARAKRYLTDEQFKSVYGVEKAQATPALFTEIYESEAAEAVAGQIDSQNSRRDTATQAAVKAQTEAMDTNRDETFTYFKNTFGEAQGAIASELASAYYIDNNMRAALTRAFSTIPEDLMKDGDVASIRQHVFSHPDVLTAMQSGTKIDAYAKSRFDLTLGQLGGFNVESFDSWHNTTNDEITSTMREVEAAVSDADTLSTPQQQLAHLKSVQRELQNWTTGTRSRIDMRRDRADRWVEYGTGGWNEVKANELLTGLDGSVQGVADRINNRILELEAQINEQPPTREQASAAPSTTQSSVGRAVTEHGQNVEAVRDISEAVGFAFQDGTTANPLASAYDLVAAPFRLAGREIEENFVMSEAEEQRREAMREYVVKVDSALISIYAALNEQGKKDMLENLKTMTPEAFEAQYKSLFKAYDDGDIVRPESLVPFAN